MFLFFFFSSRRRHTRSLCDWSSDVCSSDLDRDFPCHSTATSRPSGRRAGESRSQPGSVAPTTHRFRYHCSVTVTPASPPSSPASPSWSRPDDAVRQAQLDAMKRRATGLLALAAAVFAGASVFEGQYPWLGYVRATAEASLVGGLADWFAVTALFRHPLGLPIPHTAIVATRKERIGRILGTFVQNHFLSREVITANLRAVRPAERAARWLSDAEHSRRIARQIAGGLAKTLEALPDEDVRVLVHEVVSARLRATRVAPALGKTLALVLADDRHQGLLNEAVRLAIVAYATRADGGRAPGPLERGLSEFGAALLTNEALLAEIDDLVIDLAATVVERYRHEIGDLIAQTVAGWDPEATSRRFELAVGRDLQFVRINGTLVGGLVGLAIYTVSQLLR